jgi:Zn-dependent peptidase ImmA (M78 family)
VASALGEAAMQAARDARVDLGFGLEGPLPDLLGAIEGPGGAHVVVLDLGEDIAGACLQRPPDLVLLFVNGTQAPVRQRFTLAHEFGHRRLGHASVIDRVADVSGATRDPSEVAANYFAAEFLIPRPAAQRWADGRALGLDDIVRLAWAYGVSAKMARVRLETCGLLVDPERIARLDREIEEENLHLGLAALLGLDDLADGLAAAAAARPRLPPALRGSALGAVLTGELTIGQGAARAGRAEADFRRALDDLGLAGLVPSA